MSPVLPGGAVQSVSVGLSNPGSQDLCRVLEGSELRDRTRWERTRPVL